MIGAPEEIRTPDIENTLLSRPVNSLFGRINSPFRTGKFTVPCDKEFARAALKSLRELTEKIARIGQKPANSLLFSPFFEIPPQFVPALPFAP